MFKKMICKNVKRSWKDYFIYIITLSLCVVIYYAFLSICSRYYHPNVGVEYSLAWVQKPLIFGITAVTFTIIFLIKYVNQYMFRKKQKEFGVMNMIGVEKRQISKIFIYETYRSNVIVPFIFLIMGYILLVYSLRNRNLENLVLQMNLLFNGIVNTILSITLILNVSKYRWAMDKSEKNIYLIFLIISVILSVSAFFLVINKLILVIKKKSTKIRYKDTNLFLFGQLTAKLQTSKKTMSLICLSLMGACILGIMAPILGEWVVSYLDKRCIYDIQINYEYREIIDMNELKQPEHSYVYDLFEQESIEMTDAIEFQTYFLEEEDFYRRNKYDFPILCMPLSTWNKLRTMSGENAIELSDHEFTTQWAETAAQKTIDQFLVTHNQISVENRCERL